MILFKDDTRGRNLLKFYLKNESNSLYLKGIREIEQHGYHILAVVCDGRRGLMQNLRKYPVRLCKYAYRDNGSAILMIS